MSFRTKLALAAGAALSATLALTTSGGALASGTHQTDSARAGATYVAFTGGATTLALDPGTAQALTDNGISVAPASEARVNTNGIAFPIQGGLLNAKTLAGKITHSGGLTFTAGGQDLTIRDFTINTAKKTLTAFVDEAGVRLTVLDLKLGKATVKVTRTRTVVSNVKAVLDPAAADALNAYYSTTLFQGGLKIGTATVKGSSKLVKG